GRQRRRPGAEAARPGARRDRHRRGAGGEEVKILLNASPAVVLLALIPLPAAAADPGRQTVKLTVWEGNGIRRFGYPVTAVVPLKPPVKDADHFRLLDDGKPVPAQFRPQGDTREGVKEVVV